MTAEIEKLLARLEKRGQQDGEMANHYVRRMEVDRIEAATALRAMQAEKRELALDVLATSGQAQEAYEAQLAAEAKLAEVEKERDDAVKEAGIQMRHLQVLGDSLAAAEAKLETCEKYRDAYAECDRIGTQAVRDLEAKVAELTRLTNGQAEVIEEQANTIIRINGRNEAAEATVSTLTAQVEAMRGEMTPQKAAQFIIDHVLQKASMEAVQMRLLMCKATMTQRHPSLPMHRRWAMVNEAIHTLAALTTEKNNG